MDQKAHLLEHPKTENNFAIAQHLASVRKVQDVDDTDELVPFQGNALIELVHTALSIINDLENTPGHSAAWCGLDKEHVAKVIPQSLYTLLSVLFRGTDVFDEESSQLDDHITSIAYNICYLVSKKKN